MIAVRHHRYFETCSCDLEINLGKPLKRVHNWISGSSTEEKDEKCLYSRSFEMPYSVKPNQEVTIVLYFYQIKIF